MSVAPTASADTLWAGRDAGDTRLCWEVDFSPLGVPRERPSARASSRLSLGTQGTGKRNNLGEKMLKPGHGGSGRIKILTDFA